MNKRLETFYDRAYDWILNFGPRIIIAIIVLFVGTWLIRILRKWLFGILDKHEIEPSVQGFLHGVLNISLQVLLLLAIMQIVGIQMTIFAAVITSFGVAAGLALSGTLQNFASGVLILLLKPFRVRDIISSQGQEGIVTSIQLFYTTVLTYDNKTLIIPNSKLSNDTIINLSREGTRRLDVELKLNYSFDIGKVKSIIEQTIINFQKINKTPAHRIGISGLDTDGYRIVAEVWVDARAFEDIRMAFEQLVIEDLKRSGIKLPGM
jgi:small conductance mechanosensitive channel